MEENKCLLIKVLVLAMNKAFYFTTNSKDFKVNDFIVVETTRGIELGKVVAEAIEKEIIDLAEYPRVIRKGYNEDYEVYLSNIERAKEAIVKSQEEANKLGLDMKIFAAEYTLDITKIIISYLSETRVDFRELLKVLASLYKCRIELRQIGARDKAKMIGGIGICGLKLCCSSFLNEFDGISITMAKNQMLALNIPKLSGHCGKLICCLKYENDTYLELQKELPRIGTRVRYENDIYKITSMNVITKMIRIENKDNIATVPYEQIKDDLLPKDYPMNVPESSRPKIEEPKNVAKEEQIEEVKEQKIESDTNVQSKNNNVNKNHSNNKNNHYNNHGHNNHHRPFNKNKQNSQGKNNDEKN